MSSLFEAAYYAEPIPSLGFGLATKINIIRAKSKLASYAEMMSGHSFFCSCDSAVRFLDSKIQANVDYCYVRLRAECTLSQPTLTDSSLAAKGRAEALHVKPRKTRAGCAALLAL